MTIRKQKNQWCVFSKDGSKKLGCHSTKEKALKQLRAVEISKAMGEVQYSELVSDREEMMYLEAYNHMVKHLMIEKIMRDLS